MAHWVDIGPEDAIAVGKSAVVEVSGTSFAIYRTARGVFASGNSCPHRGGPLGEGDLIGDEIVCPWHFWAFNVETGCSIDPNGPAIKTYPVKSDAGRLLIQLDDSRGEP